MSILNDKILLVLLFVLLGTVSADIPPYIKVCNRNDPKLAQCIINSIEHMRPKLKDGIPELNIPPIEPLPLNEIMLKSGPSQAQINANISNLMVYGPSSFKILDLKPDLAKTRFLVRFTTPTLYFEGDYDIDMNVLLVKYKGKGPLHGNFTDYVFDCFLKGDKVQRNNKTYLEFRRFSLKLHTGKSYIHLGNLFGGKDSALQGATNDLIQENTDIFINEIKPALEKSLSDKFTDIANSIMRRFTYDELFPSS